MTGGTPQHPYRHALLTVEQMARADRAAIDGGTPGAALMEKAGHAVAAEICRRWDPRPVSILCGPGNNGGDGFVVARVLARRGWPVRVGLMGQGAALQGDAAGAAAQWGGPVEALAPDLVDGADLIVDALFGAGLARAVDGVAADVLSAADASDASLVAVDIPSGVHGDTGAVLGTAATAALTVTFFRRKPGHLLLPGRLRCGETVTADIGIPKSVLGAIAPQTWANHPELWPGAVPRPTLDTHKYRRGHALILGGPRMTGAGRLAARAALRSGAGLVTIACPSDRIDAYLADTAAVLCAPLDDAAALNALVEECRVASLVAGPGLGRSERTQAFVDAVLDTGIPCVLDADALTLFEDRAADLAKRLAGRTGPAVLTPHDGEFRRLFGSEDGDKLSRARAAAAETGAVLVFKGGDTVIAAPDGRAVINENAPAWLATAGSGDVLAGAIGGLLAQGVDAFAAASAAVWMHGAAAGLAGPGLIADDLPDKLPSVLKDLTDQQASGAWFWPDAEQPHATEA